MPSETCNFDVNVAIAPSLASLADSISQFEIEEGTGAEC